MTYGGLQKAEIQFYDTAPIAGKYDLLQQYVINTNLLLTNEIQLSALGY